ncbi:hypothetical protein [Paludisphaera mucosa]|uniref:Phytase-like domain-containing protein n=1 Tax=Paludisphaera mucosa TaxID=3030827 RepID=A0ABT6FLA2_9BACT|nr:hypothetical protein [Paludisphaera mucosa]MDG3008361.1 hypothetical protein [Paludisphaera mucosa]
MDVFRAERRLVLSAPGAPILLLAAAILTGVLPALAVMNPPEFHDAADQPATGAEPPSAAVPEILKLPGSAAELAGVSLARFRDAASAERSVLVVSGCGGGGPINSFGQIHNLVVSATPMDRNAGTSSLRLDFLGAPEKVTADSIEDTEAINGTLEVLDPNGAVVMKTNTIRRYTLTGSVPRKFELTGEAVMDRDGAATPIRFDVSNLDGPLSFSIRNTTGTVLASSKYAPSMDSTIQLKRPHGKSEGIVRVLDAGNGQALDELKIEGQMGGSVWDGEHVWQIVYSASKIVEIGLTPKARIVGSIPTPGKGHWGGLAFDGKNLWIHGKRSTDQGYVLVTISREDGRVLKESPADPAINGLAWIGGRLYAAINGQELRPMRLGSSIRELDAATGAFKPEEYAMPDGVFAHELEHDGDGSLLICTCTAQGYFDAPLSLRRMIMPKR